MCQREKADATHRLSTAPRGTLHVIQDCRDRSRQMHAQSALTAVSLNCLMLASLGILLSLATVALSRERGKPLGLYNEGSAVRLRKMFPPRESFVPRNKNAEVPLRSLSVVSGTRGNIPEVVPDGRSGSTHGIQ